MNHAIRLALLHIFINFITLAIGVVIVATVKIYFLPELSELLFFISIFFVVSVLRDIFYIWFSEIIQTSYNESLKVYKQLSEQDIKFNNQDDY